MKRPAYRVAAIAVLEEAFELLRQAPATVVLRYYAGSVPFVLSGCFFTLDLLRNPLAAGRSGLWALAMAVLYLWMKLCQASFAAGIRRELGGAGCPRETGGRLQAAVDQLAWQGLAPWALTLAALASLPFGWVYAFYQSLSVTGDAATAWRQAKAWPRQNHGLLLILGLFSLVVAANALAAIYVLPVLASSLLGIEIHASMAPANLLLVTLGATYLVVGPLAKTAYALRGFYSDSRRSGEDLEARLRSLSSRAAILLALALLFGAAGAPAAAPAEPETIDSQALERELERQLSAADYDWSRAPAAAEAGFLERLMLSGARAFSSLWEWLDELVRRMLEAFEDDRPSDPASPGGGFSTPRVLVALAGLLVVAALAYLLTRGRAATAEAAPDALPAPVVEALEGDDAAADRLPFEGWLEAAHDLLLANDRRRAARALYLATLSFMAHADLVRLARHKSNLDYRDELGVRARRWPGLPAAFADSVEVVERIWYGRHPAGDPELERLRANLDRMREQHGAA